MQNTMIAPQVSVIIPIYGVESYIEQCARSLFEQTLERIEYIFVNDCTKDRSVDILKGVLAEYPHRESAVTIIDLSENKGLPNARKCGLSYATGEYVIHCDSDDWVERDMYERLYDVAHNEDLDIVECDMMTHFKDSELYMNIPVSFKWTRSHFTPYAVCKLVKRSLYDNDIMFPVANMAEDMVLNLQLSYFAKNVKHINKAYYHYRLNNDSITGKTSEESCLKKVEEMRKNINIIETFLSKHSICDEYKTDLIWMKFVAKNQLVPLISQSKYRKMRRYLYKEINIPFIFSRVGGFGTKILFVMRFLGFNYQKR